MKNGKVAAQRQNVLDAVIFEFLEHGASVVLGLSSFTNLTGQVLDLGTELFGGGQEFPVSHIGRH